MARSRSSRTWLASLIRLVTSATGEPAPLLADDAAFEAWLAGALELRGFAQGVPKDVPLALEGDAAGAGGPYGLLNTVAQMLALGDGLIRGQMAGLPRIHRAHLLLEALAWTTGDAALAEATERLDSSEDNTASNRVAAQLAGRLDAGAIEAGDPLLGHPFHQILRYSDARLFAEVLWRVLQAHLHPDHDELIRAQGRAENMVYAAISASVALAAADGVVDAEEVRLLEALFAAARLDAHEVSMLRAELQAPASPSEIVAHVADPVQQQFMLRLLFLTAYVNGTLAESERALIEALAQAFGVSAEVLERYEFEALASYAAYADLNQALSPSRVLRRARQRFSARIEAIITKNAGRIWDELRETTELVELLAREASGQGLTVEQRERARAQLRDLARVVPALAIFAAPGGTVLLPLLAKHLPFDLRPSSFKEDESI